MTAAELSEERIAEIRARCLEMIQNFDTLDNDFNYEDVLALCDSLTAARRALAEAREREERLRRELNFALVIAERHSNAGSMKYTLEDWEKTRAEWAAALTAHGAAKEQA